MARTKKAKTAKEKAPANKVKKALKPKGKASVKKLPPLKVALDVNKTLSPLKEQFNQYFSQIKKLTSKSNQKKLSLPSLSNRHLSKRTYLIIAIIGLLLLGFYRKNLFLAAMVGNSPISNIELLSRMNEQYRKQTLDQLINEKIIFDKAKKQGVSVTGSEIDQKIASIEASVGGANTLDGLLAQQGQDRASLREQVRIQLTVEKLYGNEATVSAEEVQQYIEQNKSYLQSTDSAKQVEEATQALKQKKLSDIFNQKFQQLKQQANIQIF